MGPGMRATTISYIEWRRSVLLVRNRGEPEPAMPKNFVPSSIQLDLTTACNSDCPGCIDFAILNQKETHNYAQLLETIQYMISRGLRSVILIGGGEPAIHPKFREVVHFLKDHGLQVAIVSNGLFHAPILDVASLLTPPDWLRISLDAGSDPTFQTLRRPRHPTTLEEVCSLAREIRELNPDLPIGYSFVVSWPGAKDTRGDPLPQNIDEIVLAAELAEASGFSYISVKAYLQRSLTGSEAIDPEAIKNFDATIERIGHEIAQARKLAKGGFEVIVSKNLRALMDGTWRRYMNQPRTCHKQALQWVISPLGTYNCPAWRGNPKALITDSAPFSNRKAGDTLKAVARIIDGFDAKTECSKIVCFYNDLNWGLESIINGDDDLPPGEIFASDCFL